MEFLQKCGPMAVLLLGIVLGAGGFVLADWLMIKEATIISGGGQ